MSSLLATLLLVLQLAFLCAGCGRKPVLLGSLDFGGDAGSAAGTVHILNSNTLLIRNFSYDVPGGLVGFFCAGEDPSDLILIPTGIEGRSSFVEGFSADVLETRLVRGLKVSDLTWFGLCGLDIPALQMGLNVTSFPLASMPIPHSALSSIPCETTYLGDFPSGPHRISGRVYLLNRNTFAIVGFSYDGQAPDAFFWVGAGSSPSISGAACTYESSIDGRLPAFSHQDLVVEVPERLQGNIVVDYLGVWCRSNNVNLGHVTVPSGLITTPPPPAEDGRVLLGHLTRIAHNVQGSLYALDNRTLLLTNFYYDGTARGTRFWAVRGRSIFSDDTWIIPDETGSTEPLGAYVNRTLTLTLPNEITVHDIDHFSIWCIPFRISFGDVRIPDEIILGGPVEIPTLPPITECPELIPIQPVNCIQLREEVTMSWVIDPMNDNIVIELCGCVLPDNFIAFGLSGSAQRTQMVRGDATMTWLDNEGVHAQDLDLTAYSQCLLTESTGGALVRNGACPDEQNDVYTVSGYREGCTTCIRYTRPISSPDPRDRPFLLGEEQYVIWSVGPVGSLVTPLGTTIPVPFRHYLRADPAAMLRVNFSRSPVDECQLQCRDCEVPLQPWPQPQLEHTTLIRAQIGQSGGERGYIGITGTSGWGISWYLNGLLIPNITVYRNVTYTFMAEGGTDPSTLARYHPFYITSSERGGFLAKSLGEQQQEVIYAGFDGNRPIGVGRYCEYTSYGGDLSSTFDSFDEYRTSLTLDCDDGEPGTFTWTPDSNTPDVVYYQCATHQFLGWKIHVADPTDEILAGLQPTPPPPLELHIVDNTPEVDGNHAKLNFTLSRPVESLSCDLNFQRRRTTIECSSGHIVLTNLAAGSYTIRIIALDGDERKVVRGSFRILSSPDTCSAHLINDGIVVGENGGVCVQFGGNGGATEFTCQLNQQSPTPCTSPLELSGLSSGDHRLRIQPQGCRRNQPLVTRFTF